jgi:hypothetical protein
MPTDTQPSRPPQTGQEHPAGRREWAGKTGKPRPPAVTPVIETCSVDACGTPADGFRPVFDRPPADGMTRVSGSADGATEHWYCVGRCAAIACARAELRAIPPRPGGDQ